MPKVAAALTAIQVSRLKEPGFHAVGTVAGLYLSVGEQGTAQRSWVLRLSVGGKRREVGLGPYPEVPLALAHEKARALKEKVRQGIDPIAERQTAKAAASAEVWTFDKCAEKYIEGHRGGWKNPKHADQWVNTLATYVSPIMGHIDVKDITVGHVLAVIEPHWTTKNETMARVRGRIELVLAWAAARGYRPKEFNPAAWKGNLEHTLPSSKMVNGREHHKSLPYTQAPDLWNRLQAIDAMGARCLQWVMLTACRSGEARGAVWSEIDEAAGIWIVPAERMKAGEVHRVALSKATMDLLKALPRYEPAEGQPDYIFPGRSGGQLSDMTLNQMMRRMKLDAVPHGLRATFATWTAEQTSYPSEMREIALAHKVGTEVAQAYQRSDMVERRRQMMEQWAQFITSTPSAVVVPIRAAA